MRVAARGYRSSIVFDPAASSQRICLSGQKCRHSKKRTPNAKIASNPFSRQAARRGSILMTATISTDAALVVGASGGIGAAVLQQLLESGQFARVVAVSRADRPDNLAQHWDRLWWIHSDYSETSIAAAIEAIASADWELRRVVICNGILHQSNVSSLWVVTLHKRYCLNYSSR